MQIGKNEIVLFLINRLIPKLIMPPTDSTPSLKGNNGFELLNTLKAYNKIPVSEYKSTKTGLTVVIAEVDGPIVNGYFCLVTEAFDDDGLPHTLEHLIFLGSETYPYKGVLDLLANRCLASGTNAWTDTDHTCYTMETAGNEGFLTLMPIFLDHILYPVLSDEGFVTEVHHITGEGEDAGVVYCEMQGRENSAESRVHLSMARAMYPGKCGYSSETGGIMKNLRESCNNTKVRNYHKEFYRPENLKLVITGQVKPEDVFKALEVVEDKILSKGPRGDFTRPWQTPVAPLRSSEELTIKYPADDETNGICLVAWRGPCAVNDIYGLNACTIVFKYLTDVSVSPLQQAFVEIPDPYCSRVGYSMCENSTSCVYLHFENVPMGKLQAVKPKLDEVLKKIVDDNDVDMEMMKTTINKFKLESLSSLENNPHHQVAFMIIGQMLYGNTKKDLEERVNPLVQLESLANESKEFWLAVIKKYLVTNEVISIQGIPSTDEHKLMAETEAKRIEDQCECLGEEGLAARQKILDSAIEFNERPAPDELLVSVPIPSVKSITYHPICRYSSIEAGDRIDLTNTSLFTYFDHIQTNFVYMYALLDTSTVPQELRLYLPLLLETLLESSIQRGDTLVPYEQVVAELNADTVAVAQNLGLGHLGRFKCGTYSHTAMVSMQVEAAKYDKGIDWLREILFQTVLSVDRLKIIATKIVNEVSQAKRSGRGVVGYLMKGICYKDNSNVQAAGILQQQKFLNKVMETLDSDKSYIILDELERVRKVLTDVNNMSLYFAGDLDSKSISAAKINDVLPESVRTTKVQKPLNVTFDSKLIKSFTQEDLSGDSICHAIIGMGCIESSFFYQATPSIESQGDPDLPALLLYLQYLTQAEGAMWRQIRGKGYSYGYGMLCKPSEGLLYLIFSKSTNIVGAYSEARDILEKQLNDKVWEERNLASAKSSLIFEIIDDEKTIGSVISLSLCSYFQGVDIKYNRTLLELVDKVTVDDLNRVGEKYVRPLLNPSRTKTAIVCDLNKAEEIKKEFCNFKIDLNLYKTVESSFLA